MKAGAKAPAWGQCGVCKARIFGTHASAHLYIAQQNKLAMEAEETTRRAASPVDAKSKSPVETTGDDGPEDTGDMDGLPEEWGDHD